MSTELGAQIFSSSLSDEITKVNYAQILFKILSDSLQDPAMPRCAEDTECLLADSAVTGEYKCKDCSRLLHQFCGVVDDDKNQCTVCWNRTQAAVNTTNMHEGNTTTMHDTINEEVIKRYDEKSLTAMTKLE